MRLSGFFIFSLARLVFHLGVPGATGGKFTVAAVAEIITLWPRHERLANSWKINERIRAHHMGVLAALITAATERR
jgi:hypothetical protein